MDFVVAGLGFGALIVVIGFVIRDLGPLLWERLGHGAFSKTQEEQERWRGLCHRIANVLTLAGSAVLIVTIAAVLIGVSDTVGEIAALAAGVASVMAMIVFIGMTAREYQQSTVSRPQMPANLSRQSSLGNGRTAGAASSIQRNETPLEPGGRQSVVEAAAATLVPTPVPEPEISDPFDAAKLLPLELDEHDRSALADSPAGDSTRAKSELVPAEVGRTEFPKIEAGAERELGEEIGSPAVESAELSAGAFRSRLLADIGSPDPGSDSNGIFSSSLLADVEKADVPDEANYQSPLLANLADEGTKDSVHAVGPEDDTESGGEGSNAAVDEGQSTGPAENSEAERAQPANQH